MVLSFAAYRLKLLCYFKKIYCWLLFHILKFYVKKFVYISRLFDFSLFGD